MGWKSLITIFAAAGLFAIRTGYTQPPDFIKMGSFSVEPLGTTLPESRKRLTFKKEDYKQVFHEEPPLISGVAIMTDTDNTGESAIACCEDNFFKKEAS